MKNKRQTPARPSIEEMLARSQATITRLRAERTASGQCPTCGDRGRYGARPCTCTAGQAVVQRIADCRWLLAGIPRAWQGWRLDTWPYQTTPAWPAARSYLDGWQQGQSLLIVGPSGSGKTGLALGLARAIIRQQVAAGEEQFSLSFATAAQLPARSDKDALRPHTGCDLLVLDDLEYGAVGPVSRLIYERHAQGRAVIATTSLSLAGLEEHFGAEGPRLVRRLHEMCGPHVLRLTRATR